MQFVVYGEWQHGSEPDEEVGERLAGALEDVVGPVEVWTGTDDPQVLMTAFEVEADGYEPALDAGRAALTEAGRAVSLDGRLARVTSMTEEGYRTWSA